MELYVMGEENMVIGKKTLKVLLICSSLIRLQWTVEV